MLDLRRKMENAGINNVYINKLLVLDLDKPSLMTIFVEKELNL